MKKILAIAFAVIAAAVGGAIGRYAVREGSTYYRAVTFDASDMDRILADSNMKMYRVMQQRFPSDYAQLVNDLTALLKSGTPTEQLLRLSMNETARIRKKYAYTISSTPDQSLILLLRSSANLHSKVFQVGGQPLCNEFAKMGAPALLGHSNDYLLEIDEQSSLLFEAMYQAMQHPTPVGEAQEADWGAVFEEFRDAGNPDSYRDILVNERLDSPELCPALIGLINAMNATAGEPGHRVRAAFVKQLAGS